MELYSGYINRLIEELSRLPGIGSKSAQRLAFYLISMPEENVERLATTMIDTRKNIRYCSKCYTLTDHELCPICANEKRDKKKSPLTKKYLILNILKLINYCIFDKISLII